MSQKRRHTHTLFIICGFRNWEPKHTGWQELSSLSYLPLSPRMDGGNKMEFVVELGFEPIHCLWYGLQQIRLAVNYSSEHSLQQRRLFLFLLYLLILNFHVKGSQNSACFSVSVNASYIRVPELIICLHHLTTIPTVKKWKCCRVPDLVTVRNCTRQDMMLYGI